MTNFAYIRTSSKTQNPDVQKLEIESAGYKIDYYYIDSNISGASRAFSRPEFNKMLNFIRSGEKLIVTKLDRLGRDCIDVINTINYLKEKNVSVIILGIGEVDPKTSDGALKIAMLSSVAQMERDLIIERTNAGLELAKSRGVRLGRKPKLNDKQKSEIFEKYSNGQTKSSLSREYMVSRATVIETIKMIGNKKNGRLV